LQPRHAASPKRRTLVCCAAQPARAKRHPSPRRACPDGDFACLWARPKWAVRPVEPGIL